MSKHTHNIDYKKAFTVKPGEQSQVVIEGEMPFELVEAEKAPALKKLGANVKIDGFRPGHVPEKVLVDAVGEMALLVEMAERAIAHHYVHILDAHKVDAIGQPQIEITKIAKDNPLGFKATVAILPDITLPDYQAIAKTANDNKETVEVTDADVEKQIKDLQRRRMAFEKLQQKAGDNPESSKMPDEVTELPTPDSEAKKNEPLPILTDEYVKGFGQPGQFESVDDFKAKLREHLEIEKKQETIAKHRASITDRIIDASEMTLPQVLIDSEINQMFAQMNEDLERSDLKMEDYLKHIKKTKEDLKKEWTPAAEKRAKLQLVLNEIAKKENITPDLEQLEKETKSLIERFKDADENRVRLYVASVLTNDAVMKFLEELK